MYKELCSQQVFYGGDTGDFGVRVVLVGGLAKNSWYKLDKLEQLAYLVEGYTGLLSLLPLNSGETRQAKSQLVGWLDVCKRKDGRSSRQENLKNRRRLYL
jgi:hypothetical protein